MSIIFNVQYSVFANNRIEPTPDNIGKTLKRLNELGSYSFLPNMINGQNIDIVAGVMNPVNNISFVSLDRQVQIACMNDRLDAVMNGTPQNQSLSIGKRLEFSEKILGFLMDEYHIYSNRLAINVSLLSNLIEKPIQETCLGKNMYKALDFYNGKTVDEWSSRTNSRQTIQMAQEELLNVITELSVVTDNMTKKNRFMCHMDINTVFENGGYRFASADLGLFREKVLVIVNEIKNNFEGLDNEY